MVPVRNRIPSCVQAQCRQLPRAHLQRFAVHRNLGRTASPFEDELGLDEIGRIDERGEDVFVDVAVEVEGEARESKVEGCGDLEVVCWLVACSESEIRQSWNSI